MDGVDKKTQEFNESDQRKLNLIVKISLKILRDESFCRNFIEFVGTQSIVPRFIENFPIGFQTFRIPLFFLCCKGV